MSFFVGKAGTKLAWWLSTYFNFFRRLLAGITALEMAEGKPPYGDVHPMRAIFMIPTKPPPSLRESNKWSLEFKDFVNRCLVKEPSDRPSAVSLLDHDFISKYGNSLGFQGCKQNIFWRKYCTYLRGKFFEQWWLV